MSVSSKINENYVSVEYNESAFEYNAQQQLKCSDHVLFVQDIVDVFEYVPVRELSRYEPFS